VATERFIAVIEIPKGSRNGSDCDQGPQLWNPTEAN